MADDTEKAILYAFDQSGAVPPDLRERAVAYLRELQARRGRVAVAPRRVTNPLSPATRFTADARSFAPGPPPLRPVPIVAASRLTSPRVLTPLRRAGLARRLARVRRAVPHHGLPRGSVLVPPDARGSVRRALRRPRGRGRGVAPRGGGVLGARGGDAPGPAGAPVREEQARAGHRQARAARLPPPMADARARSRRPGRRPRGGRAVRDGRLLPRPRRPRRGDHQLGGHHQGTGGGPEEPGARAPRVRSRQGRDHADGDAAAARRRLAPRRARRPRRRRHRQEVRRVDGRRPLRPSIGRSRSSSAPRKQRRLLVRRRGEGVTRERRRRPPRRGRGAPRRAGAEGHGPRVETRARRPPPRARRRVPRDAPDRGRRPRRHKRGPRPSRRPRALRVSRPAEGRRVEREPRRRDVGGGVRRRRAAPPRRRRARAVPRRVLRPGRASRARGVRPAARGGRVGAWFARGGRRARVRRRRVHPPERVSGRRGPRRFRRGRFRRTTRDRFPRPGRPAGAGGGGGSRRFARR